MISCVIANNIIAFFHYYRFHEVIINTIISIVIRIVLDTSTIVRYVALAFFICYIYPKIEKRHRKEIQEKKNSSGKWESGNHA